MLWGEIFGIHFDLLNFFFCSIKNKGPRVLTKNKGVSYFVFKQVTHTRVDIFFWLGDVEWLTARFIKRKKLDNYRILGTFTYNKNFVSFIIYVKLNLFFDWYIIIFWTIFIGIDTKIKGKL